MTISPAPWTAPSIAALQPHLPQYRIESQLGQGGMGAVYQARQTALHRPVAIKVLPLGLNDEHDDPAERFSIEARAMARLTHPGIVAAYDFGQTPDGLLYYVMEFVDGTDVHRLVSEQGRLSPEQALAIAANVCEALAYAHANGVVHRDIKPANILISRSGQVKIADFGLARMDAPAIGLTRDNLVMGSPDYVAPEALITGRTADHRADLYAVGVMLYYMLMAEVPRGVFEMPARQVPGLDPRFDAVITRAMQKDPQRRYQSADEMHEALHQLAAPPPPARPLSPPSKSSSPPKSAMPLLTLSALTVLATTASVAFFLGKSQPLPATPDAASVSAPVAKIAPAPQSPIAAPASVNVPPQVKSGPPVVTLPAPDPARKAPPPDVPAVVIASKPASVQVTSAPIVVAQATTTSPLAPPPADSPFIGEWEAKRNAVGHFVLLPDGTAELWNNGKETKYWLGFRWYVTPEGITVDGHLKGNVTKYKLESRDKLTLIESTMANADKEVIRAETYWRIKQPATPASSTGTPSTGTPPPPPAAPPANAPAELTVLQQQYDKLLAERVTGVYDAALTQLNTGYTGGLDRALAEAQKTGQLDAVLAFEEDKKSLAAKQPVPATDDAKTPEPLKKLRTIYRAALAKLDTERSTNLANLVIPFTTRLKQLETDLTKQARIPDAKVVKEYREGLGGRGKCEPGGNGTDSSRSC